MTREDKAQMILDLQEVLSNSETVYLTDISGLNATDTSNLRRACSKSEIQLRVVKNTLLKKAMERVEGKEYDEMFGTLKGNTALMIAESGSAPAKVIEAFRKKSPKPILKAAWIDSAVFVGDENLQALSNLKTKDELVGEIIGLLQSPIKTVISQLQSGGQTIAGLVKTLGDKAE